MSLDMHINVGTIIASIALIGSGAAAYASVQTVISKHEAQIAVLQEEQRSQRMEIREDLKDIRNDQKAILERVSK